MTKGQKLNTNFSPQLHYIVQQQQQNWRLRGIMVAGSFLKRSLRTGRLRSRLQQQGSK